MLRATSQLHSATVVCSGMVFKCFLIEMYLGSKCGPACHEGTQDLEAPFGLLCL